MLIWYVRYEVLKRNSCGKKIVLKVQWCCILGTVHYPTDHRLIACIESVTFRNVTSSHITNTISPCEVSATISSGTF